ncbi:MFS transporter [Streptomyces sp. NPDC001356]
MGAVGTASSGTPAWRGGFGRLWTAAVVSRFGDALRTSALPLLAVRLTGQPLVIASVTACGYLPWLLFGLFGGAVADRVGQRRAMWLVDTVRGLLVAGFALAVGLGCASIPLLIALAFSLTALQTLFDNASTALLPSLVTREALGGANARLMTGRQLAGGLLAGPFVPLLPASGAFMPFAADAGTYLVAAALVASLRVRPPEREPRPAGSTLRTEIGAGLRALWRDRVLTCGAGVAIRAPMSMWHSSVATRTARVWNVNQVTLMQQRGPGSMVGRIASAFRTSSTSGAPLGAFLGGAAAGLYGLNAPALLAAVLFASAVVVLIPGREPGVSAVARADSVSTARPAR